MKEDEVDHSIWIVLSQSPEESCTPLGFIMHHPWRTKSSNSWTKAFGRLQMDPSEKLLVVLDNLSSDLLARPRDSTLEDI